jgi:putative spermidine/putrescine transport system permease protein
VRRLLLLALGWFAVLALLVPVLHTVWVSFSPDSFLTPPTGGWSLRWYRAFLADRRWTGGTVRSLEVAGLAATLAVAFATPAAVAAARRASRFDRPFRVALLLPILVPPAAVGTGLLPLAHATGTWGTTWGLALVHATLGLPVAFLILRSRITQDLLSLESAAAGLGAGARQVLLRVTLPLLGPAIASSWIAVFVLSLNESFVTLFLATPDNETLPAIVWPHLRFSPSPLVAVASCVTSLAGGLCILGIWHLIRRFEDPVEAARTNDG